MHKTWKRGWMQQVTSLSDFLRVSKNKVNVGGFWVAWSQKPCSVTSVVNDWPFSHRDLISLKERRCGHFSVWEENVRQKMSPSKLYKLLLIGHPVLFVLEVSASCFLDCLHRVLYLYLPELSDVTLTSLSSLYPGTDFLDTNGHIIL